MPYRIRIMNALTHEVLFIGSRGPRWVAVPEAKQRLFLDRSDAEKTLDYVRRNFVEGISGHCVISLEEVPQVEPTLPPTHWQRILKDIL